MKFLIISVCLALLCLGTYLVHWLFNAREWVDYYIKQTKPELSTRSKPGSKRHKMKTALKKHRPVKKAIKIRSAVIEFLAKDNPKLAPFFIYFIMGGALILVLMTFVYMSYQWTAQL